MVVSPTGLDDCQTFFLKSSEDEAPAPGFSHCCGFFI
jgi:hypothetical protein